MKLPPRIEEGATGRNTELEGRVHKLLVWVSPVLSTAIAGLSYMKVAQPLTNDFERFDDLRLTFAFFVLFVFWLVWYLWLAAYRALQLQLGARVWTVFLLTSLPLLISFPVGSRDVFAYAFYGKMWAVHGVEPAQTPPTLFSGDAWFPWLQAWWKEGPAGYGPLFLLQTRIVGWLSGQSLLTAVALYKLMNFALLVGSVFLVATLHQEAPGDRNLAGARRTFAPSQATLLWATNPLVLFEGLSSAHNDLAMAVLMLAALRSWQRGAVVGATAWWTLSVWYKWYTVVLLPFWLLSWWRRDGTRDMFRGLRGALAVSLGISLLVVFPFGDAAWEILAKPATIEIGARLMPTEFPPTLWLMFELLVTRAPWPLEIGRILFDVARYAFLFVGWGALLWWQWSRSYRFELLVCTLCLATLWLFGLAVTVLWPWHLLVPCALSVILGSGGARLRGWWSSASRQWRS